MLRWNWRRRSRLRRRWGKLLSTEEGISRVGVKLIWFCRVYALLRQELWGEAIKKFQKISYVHGRMTSAPAKVKI